MLGIEVPFHICARKVFMIIGLVILIGAFVLLIRIPGFAHAGFDQEEFEYPSFDPTQTEVVIEGNREFGDSCMARVKKSLEKLGALPGKRLTTRSKEFGSIFRLDFQIPSDDDEIGYVNRVVCWGTSPSNVRFLIIIGSRDQKLEPLP